MTPPVPVAATPPQMKPVYVPPPAPAKVRILPLRFTTPALTLVVVELVAESAPTVASTASWVMLLVFCGWKVLFQRVPSDLLTPALKGLAVLIRMPPPQLAVVP